MSSTEEFLIAYEHVPSDGSVYLLRCVGESDRNRMRTTIEDRGHRLLVDRPLQALSEDNRRRFEQQREMAALVSAIRTEARSKEDDGKSVPPDGNLPF